MKHKETIFALLLLVAMMLWGLSWPLSKIMVAYLSPFKIASIRYGLVALSFVPLMLFLRIPFAIPSKSYKSVALTSVCNALYTLAFYLGLLFGNAGAAGVIVTTLAPILASFIGVFIYRSTLLGREKIGLLLGLISGGFLMGVGNLQTLLTPFNLIFLIAALLWGCVNLASKSATSHINAITLNFYSSLFCSIIFSPSLLFSSSELFELDGRFWFCMVAVALLCTTFATTIFYKGISTLGINKGGSFMLSVPIFAVLFSWLILGEVPKSNTIIGGIFAMLGIYLIHLYKPLGTKSKR
ncbi:hypothetical protein BKH46_00995 [Helicobacter sp. 12S02634-8]|uniref:DMT family transporter n=1 Tax=Helicobacter sp. 12S02634-8 TaxID=1476199 RepID=UPI000BD003BA|nr:DMT family transporter [Helicobacter sp. 12S02634-8]PAF48513.1 hypothetical protein BKH46_00995 [Helicobacter sp. 12S02634-8]